MKGERSEERKTKGGRVEGREERVEKRKEREGREAEREREKKREGNIFTKHILCCSKTPGNEAPRHSVPRAHKNGQLE